MKLINESNSLIITVSKRHGLRYSITFFLFRLFCCKYICDIYLSMLNFNGLCSSATYLLTRLPHRGLYNYNGRQIELFHLKRFNYEYINRPGLMSL